MPPKKSVVKPSAVKMEKDTVKQIVNVRVGETAIKKRQRMKKPRSAPVAKPQGVSKFGEPAKADMMSALSSFNRPNISLSLQSPAVQQPSFLNEYNMLLRELANERKQRQTATQPLAANTAPLTTNEQRNELLIPVVQATLLDPITQRFSETATQTINKEVYDDPQTSENMLSSPPNLAYKLSQKLPNSNFDYRDVDSYAGENQTEQDALAKEAVAGANLGDEEISGEETYNVKPRKARQTKPESLKVPFQQYIKEVANLNERFNLEVKPRSLNEFRTKGEIMEEISNIKKRAVQKSENPQMKVDYFFQK